MFEGTDAICILSWVAVVGLSGSYFLQAYKIHQHKEVRDLSLGSYLGMTVCFIALLARAVVEGQPIFIAKQVLTLIPVITIECQILYHRGDRWKE